MSEEKINFQKALEKGTILTGKVIMAQKAMMAGEESTLTLDCEGQRIVITESQVAKLGKSTALSSYVGSELDFIVISAPKDAPIIVGSNTKAVEKIQKPIKEKLRNGEPIEGTITNILGYGAYLTLNGINVFIKNDDFSDDINTLKDVAKVGQKIVVKYKKESETGKIYVEAVKKYRAMCTMQIDEFKKGQTVLGTVRAVYPSAVFVRIAPCVDVMTPVPQFAELDQGYKVRVEITKKIETKNQLRGKIVGVIS